MGERADVAAPVAACRVQAAARVMRGGRIVLVASTDAFAPEGGSFAHDVSEAGVVCPARAAALELAPTGVAGAVAYPVSDDVAWVTGTHLVVDGGQTVGLDLPDPAPTPGGRP